LEVFALAAGTGVALMISLIAAGHVALVASALMAILFAAVTPQAHLKPVVEVFLAGAFASYLLTLRTARIDTWSRSALAIAAFNTFVVLIVTEALQWSHDWQMLLWTAASGLGASFLALGLLLALDRPLNLLTAVRLAELASPQQPLLQRLVREAPGTYQGSVMVASLAEQAAEAIGINSLLVRTAALYHDIGKLRRPYFFIENQFGQENPHDRLSPYISALIISSHPTDGAEMAREAGLPPQIIDIIQQHQGTDLVRYFYEKALERAPEGTAVPEANFRYPGPKPQSKEAAVIMLVDTVEAAVRSMDDLSPEIIERMVTRQFKARLDSGQLDESPITLREISTVRSVLTASLNSALHQRIKYPEQIPEEARVLLERLPEDQRQGTEFEALLVTEDEPAAPDRAEDTGPE
jgi:hypothetical protein